MRIFTYFRNSFRWKLAAYGMAMVILATVVYWLFIDYELNTITTLSLDRNTQGTQQMVEEYLTQYADEKALSTWDQIQDAHNDLVILGRTAQHIIDHYDALEANPEIFDLALFETDLAEVDGALTTDPASTYDAFAPPPIAGDPDSQDLLRVSALLNLVMDAVFDANRNSSFVYFVGGFDAPITRAYPNIHLVSVLGESVSSLFWQDFFPDNPDAWRRWYTDPELQERVPSPVTMEAPYEDAAQQGLTVTMFYPLWDSAANEFAGVVGMDITLSNIVANVLEVSIGESGFAFLVNGNGDVIAMPPSGYDLFSVERVETRQADLIYSVAHMGTSLDPAVANMTATLLEDDQGIYYFTPTADSDSQAGDHDLAQPDDGYLVAYSSLLPFHDSQYQEDRWRIGIVVSESEIFAILRETDAIVNEERSLISERTAALAIGFSLIAFLLAVYLSTSVTRDLKTLSAAAEKVSAKEYDIDINITSTDEIGQLGHAFQTMTAEIRDYTANLEQRIAARTADLQEANAQITRLNEQLTDENVRLSAELDVARHLQMMILPSDGEVHTIQELDIAGYSCPADEVGGDYYDVLKVGDTIYLGIGDVTGHGLPAGVIMLMAQTAFLTLVQTGETDTSRIMSILNQVLYRNIIRIRDDKSMTMAVLRYNNRRFDVAGQHESVLILRADGTVEEIDTMSFGFPIGLDYDIADLIDTHQIQLQTGEIMLLYTDGITEAENSQGEQFGLSRLKHSLAESHQQDAKLTLDRVVADVFEFIGDTHIYDDISALVVKQK